jgi:hypothetical protein
MHPRGFASPLFAAITLAALALAALPAQAQNNTASGDRSVAIAKRKPAVPPREVATRAPTRLTVRRRSYLDPGTETKTHAEHFTDYAFPPQNPGTLTADTHNPAFSWTRMPFPDCFYLSGFCR